MQTKQVSPIKNPESINAIVPYAIYSMHKLTRKQVQSQRETAQHTISFLERQAKKTAKQLQMKQKTLVNYYHIKQTRFQQTRKKEELHKKRQRKLDELRKTNTSLRENSALKRNTVRQLWENSNKQSATNIKKNISESERKLTEQRELQNSLLKKRNQVFTRALALGSQHSRVRSLYHKKYMSSQVKNDLIGVQEDIKHRELQKINYLNTRQRELLQIVDRNRREHNHYDHTFQQVKTLPFDQMYPKIAKSVKSKNQKSRRSSSGRSDSLII